MVKYFQVAALGKLKLSLTIKDGKYSTMRKKPLCGKSQESEALWQGRQISFLCDIVGKVRLSPDRLAVKLPNTTFKRSKAFY